MDEEEIAWFVGGEGKRLGERMRVRAETVLRLLSSSDLDLLLLPLPEPSHSSSSSSSKGQAGKENRMRAQGRIRGWTVEEMEVGVRVDSLSLGSGPGTGPTSGQGQGQGQRGRVVRGVGKGVVMGQIQSCHHSLSLFLSSLLPLLSSLSSSPSLEGVRSALKSLKALSALLLRSSSLLLHPDPSPDPLSRLFSPDNSAFQMPAEVSVEMEVEEGKMRMRVWTMRGWNGEGKGGRGGEGSLQGYTGYVEGRGIEVIEEIVSECDLPFVLHSSLLLHHLSRDLTLLRDQLSAFLLSH